MIFERFRPLCCVFPNYPLHSRMHKKEINGVSIYFNHECKPLPGRTLEDPYVCHRDDQSLFDILSKNFYDFQEDRFDGWKYQLRMRKIGVVNKNKTFEDEWRIVCHDGYVLARNSGKFGPDFRRCNVGSRG